MADGYLHPELLGRPEGAIASPEAEIYIGFQGGTPKVGVVGPLRPAPEGGPNPLGDRVFVVYNARTGELVTGYRIGAHEKARAVKSWRPCQKVPRLSKE